MGKKKDSMIALPDERVTLANFKNLVVLGTSTEGLVYLSARDQVGVRALDLARAKTVDLVLIAGEEVSRLIGEGIIVIDGKRLRQAACNEILEDIANVARSTNLDSLEEVGNGIAPLGDDLLLVGTKSVRIRVDGTWQPIESPIVEKHFILPDPGLHPVPVAELEKVYGTTDRRAARARLFKLHRMLRQWNFNQCGDALLLCGLVFATILQAVWEWRPLVWISGNSDAGKSLLLRFLERIFGPSTLLYEGKVSEAALRQKLQHHSPATMLDEFEKNPHRERVLELLRSSGRAGTVAKGTPGHRAIEFVIRHLVWVASVDVGLSRAADQNRWIAFEMKPPKAHIDAADDTNVKAFGLEVMAAAIRVAPRARELERVLRKTQVKGVDGRTRDNFIVPTAMLSAFLEYNNEQAERFLRFWLARLSDQPTLPRESDQEALLHAILSSRVSYQTGVERVERTIGEMLNLPQDKTELERRGVKVLDGKSLIFICGKTVTRELLRGTAWAELDVNSVLARIPGAQRSKQRVAAVPSNGVVIPEFCIRRIMEEGSEQDGTADGTPKPLWKKDVV